jgi:hypothetical protein
MRARSTANAVGRMEKDLGIYILPRPYGSDPAYPVIHTLEAREFAQGLLKICCLW